MAALVAKDLILIAQALDLVYFVEPPGFAGSQKNITRSISLRSRWPLSAGRRRSHEDTASQAGRGLLHQLTSGVGGADGMLRKDSAVCNAELHHKFFLSVMCHQCYIQYLYLHVFVRSFVEKDQKTFVFGSKLYTLFVKIQHVI